MTQLIALLVTMTPGPWTPGTVSTYGIRDNSPPNSRATSLHARTRRASDLLDENAFTCAMHFPTYRHLLGRYVMVGDGKTITLWRVTDHFTRKSLRHRLDMTRGGAKRAGLKSGQKIAWMAAPFWLFDPLGYMRSLGVM